MRTITLLFISILLMCTGNELFADEFLRDLPSQATVKSITKEKFPNNDAVIILKEQSIQVQYVNLEIQGEEISAPTTSLTKIMIVKVLNERAVRRYGSFELEYVDKYVDEFKNRVIARARVLKENGNVEVLDGDEIKTITSRKDKNGDPITKKVLFKVPNLAPGDVIQIEYQHDNLLVFSLSSIFFYNDVDYVMYSNLYITLLSVDKFKIYNFPENKVGSPQVQQISKRARSGETYFWSLRNLEPIPKESYARPFEETSFFTAFVLYRRFAENDAQLWSYLANKFRKTYLDNGGLSNSQCEKLGFPELSKLDSVNFEKIDNLYSSIKKYFVIENHNSLFPLNADTDDLFDSKKGNASDIAIAMYKILKKRGIDPKIAWIRDRRDGIFDLNVPSIRWFSRVGVLVNINGKEKVYDFDRCIAGKYKTPWFLNNVKLMVIDEDGCSEKILSEQSNIENNYVNEYHKLKFTSNLNLIDTMDVIYCGSKAESYRGDLYELEEYEVKDRIKEKISTSCLKEIKDLSINDYYNDDSIKINLSGSVIAQPEVLDSFIVFKLNNNIIKEFRDLIFTNLRRSDFQFESPFYLKTEWEVELPQGFKLKESLPSKTLNSPSKVSTQIDFKREGTKLKISARILFKEKNIPANNCSDLLNLLDRSMKAIEKDIVLKKI